jgi:putative endopeptidase
VQKELHAKLRKLNEDALKKNAKSGSDQQIGDFWYSAMDTVTIEKNGITPLNDELGKIAAIKGKDELPAIAAHMHNTA